VTEASVFGGRLAFSGALPIGNIAVDGDVQVQLPGGGTVGLAASDTVTGLGDPAVGAALGWKRRSGDKFRAWSVYTSAFIPIGDYEVGRIANLGHNRWAADFGAAYTMANFKRGRELSSVLGFTINGDNDDTGYSSGDEMHLEVVGKQYLPNHLSFGIAAYWNEQLTADTNNGPVLGDFEGRVFGVGPELAYQFTQIKAHPVTVDLRWYHEFDAEKRIEGEAVYLTVSLPLSVTQPKAQDWSADEQP
jgi:hypothetical protein